MHFIPIPNSTEGQSSFYAVDTSSPLAREHPSILSTYPCAFHNIYCMSSTRISMCIVLPTLTHHLSIESTHSDACLNSFAHPLYPSQSSKQYQYLSLIPWFAKNAPVPTPPAQMKPLHISKESSESSLCKGKIWCASFS